MHDPNIKTIFQELKRDKTLVKLRLIGKSYERLTILTGIRKNLLNSFFLIGYPEGFKEAVAYLENWKIEFEFTGADNLKYLFITSGGKILGDEIRFPFPETISRHQKRQHFRLDAPDGTTLNFKLGTSVCKKKVIDISIGGTLIAFFHWEDEAPQRLPFKVGDILQDVVLAFSSPIGGPNIHIKKAAVVRFDTGNSNAKMCCGIQFTEIDEGQDKALTEFIYNYQRQLLRNRQRVDN
jgi:c-di-GMP-binding flagellar brake protein YcgR